MGRRLDASRIETRMIPIDDIEDHKDNYNLHPESQIAQLAKSHAEFDQYRSILVWARPGGKYIRVVGHGYSQGAKQEGAKFLRAEVLPEDTPAETVKAIMLADNLHAHNSSPDDTILAQLLTEQQNAGYDLASLGTDDETLRQMLAELGDDALSEGEDNEEGEKISGLDAPDLPYKNQFAVAVICSSEAEQQKVFEALQNQGYTCKVLVV